jgi:hypothetical protein
MTQTPGENRLGRTAQTALGWVCLLAFLGSLSWVLNLGYSQPVRNFDLLDYVAIALEWVEPDPEVVHRRTYEILEQELSPEAYLDFTQSGTFRQEIFEDWRLFDANLGFHRGRYLYSLGVLALHELGADWTAATWNMSQLFLACTAVLVLAWSRRHFSLASSSVMGMAVLYSPPVLMLAPASSPDTMAMFLVTLGLYLMLEFRSFAWAAGVLALAVLVRSDFVLICFGIGVAMFFLSPRAQGPGKRFIVGWLAVSTLLYGLVSHFARDPGWWAVFVAPFRRIADLSTVPDFKASHYTYVLGKQLQSLHYFGYEIAPNGSFVRGSTFVLVYLGAAVMGAVLALRSRLPSLQLHAAVLVGLVLSTGVRYALFPYLWDRYYVYLWVPVPLCLAAIVATFVRYVEKRERPGMLD